MKMMAPKPIAGRAKSDNLKAISWAVMVVPIFAPIITPTACVRVIRPAFTKLTNMTVVAAELWIIPVTRAPTKTPIHVLLVSAFRIPLSLSPAAFCNPLPI
jgi:hypothetical protein